MLSASQSAYQGFRDFIVSSVVAFCREGFASFFSPCVSKWSTVSFFCCLMSNLSLMLLLTANGRDCLGGGYDPKKSKVAEPDSAFHLLRICIVGPSQEGDSTLSEICWKETEKVIPFKNIALLLQHFIINSWISWVT